MGYNLHAAYIAVNIEKIALFPKNIKVLPIAYIKNFIAPANH